MCKWCHTQEEHPSWECEVLARIWDSEIEFNDGLDSRSGADVKAHGKCSRVGCDQPRQAGKEKCSKHSKKPKPKAPTKVVILTGRFVFAGQRDGRVHVVRNGVPLCGKKVNPEAKFSLLSYQIELPRIDCQRCKNRATRLVALKAE